MRRELDRAAIDRDLARASIEQHWTATKFACGMTGSTPEQGAQPGKDFLYVEGFGDVIVGPGIEALNFVAPAIARGQNQDRHGTPGPPPFTEYGNAVLFGQTQI